MVNKEKVVLIFDIRHSKTSLDLDIHPVNPSQG
jgi:hypothetical protein